MHILNFNVNAIKKSTDVEDEMVRLNSNRLQPVTQLMCNATSVPHFTIALLNVRSIVAMLPDIIANASLSSATILCFCKTWLNASQPSPALQIDIRCDRISCDNKGGVMICVPSQIKPSNTQRFAVNGIEAVSVTLESNGMQIAVLYRSSNVSTTTMLSRLLSHISMCNTPSLILGAFNEDALHHQNTALLSLMSSFGFTQLVKSPTTSQGTLIDHVYYRNPSSQPSRRIMIHIQDTYYSDHDTVYCSIPFIPHYKTA